MAPTLDYYYANLWKKEKYDDKEMKSLEKRVNGMFTSEVQKAAIKKQYEKEKRK